MTMAEFLGLHRYDEAERLACIAYLSLYRLARLLRQP